MSLGFYSRCANESKPHMRTSEYRCSLVALSPRDTQRHRAYTERAGLDAWHITAAGAAPSIPLSRPVRRPTIPDPPDPLIQRRRARSASALLAAPAA
eukprot:7124125-Prymnesium_polylepis.1